MLECDHVVKFDHFMLLARDKSDYLIQIKVKLHGGYKK